MKSNYSLQPTNFFKDLGTFILFFIFFLILFFQFPYHGSLPGHWDTWLHLSLYNYYWDYFKSLISNQEIYYAMWPTQVPYFRYGEMSLLSAILYWPFKFIIKNEIWAYYLHISSIYTLVGFSMYKLSSLFVEKKHLAILGGLLLTTSNYYLASIDQVNVISFYPSIFCLYFLVKWTRSHRFSFLYIASVCYGLQIYASGYLFFYLNIILFFWGLFYWRAVLNFKNISHYTLVLNIGILIISPYVYMYVFDSQEPYSYNAGRSMEIVSALSIHSEYFTNSLPYNLIYGDRVDRSLIENIKSIHLGVIFPFIVLISISLFSFTRKKIVAFFILLVLILFGLGPIINIGNLTFSSPIYQFILAPLGIDQLLRTPIRAMIPILVIIVLLALKILEKIKNRKIITLVIIGILVENIPYRFQYFNSNLYINVPDTLISFAQNMPNENILLILPSTRMTEKKLSPKLDETNREYIYMYWQTKFKKSMINGSNGFIPNQTINIYQSFDKKIMKMNKIEFQEKIITLQYLPLMNIH